VIFECEFLDVTGDKREKEGGFLLRFSSRMIGDGGGSDGN
jgi:hypothetical protein